MRLRIDADHLDWREEDAPIRVSNLQLRRIPQAPNYPLFLMLDLFEIGPASGHYPKTAVIHHLRGWST